MRLGVAGIALTLTIAVACGGDTDDLRSQAAGGGPGTGGQSSGGAAGNAGSAIPNEAGPGDTGAPLDASDAPELPDATDADAGCPIDTTGNVEAIATALCERSESCCSDQGLGYATADCVAVTAPVLEERLNAGLCKGGTWDPAVVAACVSGLKSLGCTEFGVNFNVVWSKTCHRVLTGAENPGTSCLYAYECFAGPGRTASCTNNECIVGTLVDEDQPCDFIGNDTGTAHVCDTAMNVHCFDGKCVGPKPIGAACSIYYNDCLSDGACFEGTCTKWREAGETCGTTLPPCAYPLKCFAGVCGGGIGQTCNDKTECGDYPLDCVFGKCGVNKFHLLGNAAPSCSAP